MTGQSHAECLPQLRAAADRTGTDITISTAPPLIATPYARPAFVCPHGTRYWVEPTGEQVAAWRRDRVR